MVDVRVLRVDGLNTVQVLPPYIAVVGRYMYGDL